MKIEISSHLQRIFKTCMMTEASGDKLLMMITACLEFVTIIVRFFRNVLLLEIIVQSSKLYG